METPSAGMNTASLGVSGCGACRHTAQTLYHITPELLYSYYPENCYIRFVLGIVLLMCVCVIQYCHTTASVNPNLGSCQGIYENYHTEETILLITDPCYGNLNQIPSQEPST